MDEKIEWLRQGIASGLLTSDEAVAKAVAMVESALAIENKEDDEPPAETAPKKRFNWKPYRELLMSGEKNDEEIAKQLGVDKKAVASARHNEKKRSAAK